MKRVFTIGERVFYEDDHESGWGKIVLINGRANLGQDICSDDCGDIITIQKEGCRSEIETTPSHIYHVAQERTLYGNPVVWEHHEDIEYPFFCPALDEHCYHTELDPSEDEGSEMPWDYGKHFD